MEISKKVYLAALLGIAVCSLLAGMVSLRGFQRQGREAGEFWSMADTAVYFANAEALATGQPLGKMFRDRLAVPALLAVTGSSPADPWPYLYLQQVPHFFIPLILAGIAGLLFENRGASLFCAVLYVAYPPAREASRIISTDFIHAFFALLSVWCTLACWRSGTWRRMLAAAACWIATMLVRPTFMWEGALLAPLLFWNVWKHHASWKKAACFLVLLMVVPCFFSALNFIQCGVATPSFAAFENLHCSLVPSIQTRLRNQAGETNRMSAIFKEQVAAQKASRDGAWGTLELWDSRKPDNRRAFAETYSQLQGDDKNYLLKHWMDAFCLVKYESAALLFDSNPFWRGESRGRNLFVLAACTGLLFVWCGHSRRQVALWLLLTLGLAVGPASCAVQLWWGRRVGLPADFILLALAGGVLVSWKRVLVLFFLCAGFKVLNLWRYDPTLNLAFLLVLAFLLLEWFGVRHLKSSEPME